MDTPDNTPPPNLGGRPPWEPTAEDRVKVKLYAGIGIPVKMIATLIGVGSDNTLSKHCAEELKVGEAEATAKIAGKLFAKAMAGDLGAIIFWLKARAGWREKHVLDDPAQRGSLADLVLASMKAKALDPSASVPLLDTDTPSVPTYPGDGSRH